LEDAAERHVDRRIDAIRGALDAADLATAAGNLLQLAAKWSPAAMARVVGDALEASAYAGREAVFLDGEDDAVFADDGGFSVFGQPFRDQVEYFRQKRVKPTKRWTDALRGVHDRAFIIAGAMDTAMLSDFQAAIADAIENGGTLEDFRKDFDRIVGKYGWQYKGERGWRTRVIFETNVRTSYMAGRLRQMRDPDVVKLRPIWQYRWGETRIPQHPRKLHQSWNLLCLAWDDPWWNTHFPPNDFLCSCGVRSLSWDDMARMGKAELDKAPGELRAPIIDPVSGQLTDHPQGVGYGWDYMPGDLWERGLTPSALIDETDGTLEAGRQAVVVDEPEPIVDLLAKAKPFKAEPLEEGLEPEDYVRAFLEPFGADIGTAVLWEDKTGTAIPISDQLFRDRAGELKVMKRGRHVLTPLMAETLMDPDEIWIGVARKVDPADAESEELVVDRRYIRVDRKTGIQIVFEIGQRFWEAITSYNPTTKKGDPDFRALDRRRGGKLAFKRKGRE
jgi:hypothetical protein